jgi:hypothetical protein
MRRVRWLLAALGAAAVFSIPLDLLDQWLIGQMWFPKNPLHGGLSGALFASIVAVSIPKDKPRRILAGCLGVGGAVFAIWAMRYLIGWSQSPVTTSQMGSAYIQIHWTLMFTIGLSVGSLATMSPKQGSFWGIQALLVVGSAVVADLTVGMLGIDMAVMNRVLYYQTVEIEVHQPVADPELLYGLKPGARLGGEGPWGLRTVTVNQFGARSPEYAQEKAPGKTRTLVFGGSTLYGAGVGNAHTTPGMMDTLLGPDHEVWNFGVCAYNTSQAAHLATTLLDPLTPDRIIIMITNTGRRAFMGGPTFQEADKSIYFDENPYLYLENFPPTNVDETTHQRALQFSALYRTFTGWQRASTDPDTTYSDRADRKSVATLEAEADKRGIEVLYVLSPSRGSEVGPQDMGVPQERWLDLHIPGRSGDYQEAHPSPAILTEYAARIVAWLNERA